MMTVTSIREFFFFIYLFINIQLGYVYRMNHDEAITSTTRNGMGGSRRSCVLVARCSDFRAMNLKVDGTARGFSSRESPET
jgi:hypothetical protein